MLIFVFPSPFLVPSLCGGGYRNPWCGAGGRVVLLGNPMPAPTACLDAVYLEGLAALADAGLIWEWCCLSESIPSITEACK